MWKYFISKKDGSYRLIDSEDKEGILEYQQNPEFEEMFLWVD